MKEITPIELMDLTLVGLNEFGLIELTGLSAKSLSIFSKFRKYFQNPIHTFGQQSSPKCLISLIYFDY